MNFKIIILLLVSSCLFSKHLNKQRNTSQIIIKKEHSRDRSEEEIITVDFEGDLSGWSQDNSNAWELTTTSSNSPSHSYHSPDVNDTEDESIHTLYSQNILLPSLENEEVIQYSFAIDCDMPDFLQDNGSTSLADYYIVSVRDVNESAWHVSNFTPTDGNNWWCADEEVGGYLDSWFQYLDTPSFTVPTGGTMSADMSWAIEDPADASVPGTCTDGWDQANVQISIDGGNTFSMLTGSIPYDFGCGYGMVYNGFECNTNGDCPGWGGGSDGWQNISFDLSAYAGQTASLRFAFYSDPSYSAIGPEDDPAWEASDYTGLQVDNIIIVSSDVFSDTGDDPDALTVSGEVWIDQFYDYCDENSVGYSGWETYGPGDPFDGNVLMNLSEFEGQTIQFKFQTIYDGDHTSTVVDNAQGEGLYIDDLYLYKVSTCNPIVPSGLNGYGNDEGLNLSWNNLNVSGSELISYDHNIFTPEHVVHIDDPNIGEAWAGMEIHNTGYSIVDSIYIYVFGEFFGYLAGFSGINAEYDNNPDYLTPLFLAPLENENDVDWIGIDLEQDLGENNWTFSNNFIIAQTLSSNYPVAYDPTAAPSLYSKILRGPSWESWSDVVEGESDPSILDGEWGIRVKVNYESPNVTYNIYRDDELIVSGLENPYYVDENIVSNQTYIYNISATYPNCGESDLSTGFEINPCETTTDECGECQGNGIDDWDCNAEQLPEIYGQVSPNGLCWDYGDACDCGGNILDECDDCAGDGIDEGACDCDGNVFDCTGTCAGVALDTDNDGVCDNGGDEIDLCPDGNTGWISTPLTDYDSDGCQDNGEDLDDDNDTLLDCWDYWHDDGELISEQDMNDLINSGECEDFALEIDQSTIPTEFILYQNHPNPFNPSTTIKFSIPYLTNVDLNIYNVLGQQIYQKSWEKLLPGNYDHTWNGEDFTSGIYIYSIETGSGVYLKEKMVLIK